MYIKCICVRACVYVCVTGCKCQNNAKNIGGKEKWRVIITIMSVCNLKKIIKKIPITVFPAILISCSFFFFINALWNSSKKVISILGLFFLIVSRPYTILTFVLGDQFHGRYLAFFFFILFFFKEKLVYNKQTKIKVKKQVPSMKIDIIIQRK